MKKLISFLITTALVPVAFMVGCSKSNPSSPVTSQGTVNMGSAASYAILAYNTITDTNNATTICGSLGLDPGSAIVYGSSMVVACGGVTNIDSSLALAAKGDLSSAYLDASSRPTGTLLTAGEDIGGKTLYPGVYKETGSLSITSADLTLDAQGNSNAVFIFQVANTLTVANGRKVNLTGSASAANVFWQVAGTSGCTLGTTVQFVGTIMAYTSIAIETNASLIGRALAETGQVSLDGNTITDPTP